MKNIITRSRAPQILILSAMLLLEVFGQPARGQGNSQRSASPVYEKAKAAAVEVLVNGHLCGTGWFADTKGFLFTAAHVIERPGQKVEGNSSAIGRIPAEVVAVDLGHDLALLKVADRAAAYTLDERLVCRTFHYAKA